MPLFSVSILLWQNRSTYSKDLTHILRSSLLKQFPIELTHRIGIKKANLLITESLITAHGSLQKRIQHMNVCDILVWGWASKKSTLIRAICLLATTSNMKYCRKVHMACTRPVTKNRQEKTRCLSMTSTWMTVRVRLCPIRTGYRDQW